jgi:predicted outer membrane repeat protein
VNHWKSKAIARRYRELEAQSELHGLFDELFEGLNITTTFEENKGGNEGAALYAAVASISG